MRIQNEQELGNYIFSQQTDEVFERRYNAVSRTRNKAAVLSDFRKRKIEKVILKYEVSKSDDLNVYRIYQREGVSTIHMHPSDAYNRILQRILSRQNIFDEELYITVHKEENTMKNWYSMHSAYLQGTKTGTDLDNILEELKRLENNQEIDHITKIGNEKNPNGSLRYDFYTKNNELIHIYVRNENKEIIEKLNAFNKATVSKKAGIKKTVIAGTCIGLSLLAASPVLVPMAKNFIISQNESMEKADKIETNMRLIQSYSMRLRDYAYGLKENEFYDFKHRVEETLLLIDENDEAYPFLQQCLEDIKNSYSSSPNVHRMR